MSDYKWIYLDMTSRSGKVLYACTKCGHTTPAPSRHHICEESQLEMNATIHGDVFPESAKQL